MNAMKITRCALPLFAALALGACEITDPLEGVDIHLDIEDVPVNINSPAVAVAPGTMTEVNTNVSFAGTVSSVKDISEITLHPSYFTFTPAAGGPGSSAAGGMASGSLFVAVASGGQPILAVTVHITNDVVTGVTPAVADLEAMTASIRANAEAAVAAVPATAARFASWRSLTSHQLIETVGSMLTSNDASLTLLVIPFTGNLWGSFSLSQFQLSASVTKAL